MKEWICVQVKHHKDIAKRIEEFQRNGWRLHTYCPAHIGISTEVNHYLLFEKGE